MFFSGVSQAGFGRPGKCRLNAVTTKTGNESCSMRKNRRREFMVKTVAFNQGKYMRF